MRVLGSHLGMMPEAVPVDELLKNPGAIADMALRPEQQQLVLGRWWQSVADRGPGSRCKSMGCPRRPRAKGDCRQPARRGRQARRLRGRRRSGPRRDRKRLSTCDASSAFGPIPPVHGPPHADGDHAVTEVRNPLGHTHFRHRC
jgi:hypothetical protein